MADMRVGSSIQATVALGQKLASLLQTLIELNPSSQKGFKDVHYDVEATSGTLRQLQDLMRADEASGSVERNTGDFENELMYRSSIQLLRQRQVKFTKKKSRKQEKAQRKWELERKVDSSDIASVTSVASSGSSSTTASTAVDDDASVNGQKPVVKDAADVVDADKNAADANQGETKSSGDTKVTESEVQGDKSKTLRSFTLTGRIGSDLPTYFFDWKQRIFGTDDKFKTDWPSTNLEAYVRHNSNFGKPTKVPFGHKRLTYGLNKVIKDGKKEKSTWNSYVDAAQYTRLSIYEIVEEANRHQSRERVCVAFQEYGKEGDDPFLLVFLSLRKEPQPISLKDAVGRTYTLPFETCKKWDTMKATLIEAFNHVREIGPHVIEGHFDLLTPNGDRILPHLWSTTIKPGASISMKMWPDTPLRGFYGPPPFLVNPHAPSPAGNAMHARMRQMQAQRMAAMRHPPPPMMRPPPMIGGGPPPPPPGGRSFPPPRKVVPIIDWRSAYEISEKEDEQLMFVDFVEELEKTKAATVADLLRKFTTLKDVTDEDSLGDFLAVDSDYDSDDSTSTSSSSELIND
ncbi:hypothetical protein INS49_010077 [Diaporthe citri]|uniref:uncharacterized protein n=1 Tax=Diaporthe citri TaxID=83186 RepID=UPI001C8262E1|nr:uncharacterized protein INS49_010077 [Diaporthe citri]KAG6361848.1 hypothetical protein INS49_010077 [Diaporthe citri]